MKKIIYYETAEAQHKHYSVGMYGGKWLPWHQGHEFCARVAANLCDKVYLILFYGGEQEEKIIHNNTVLPKKFLSLDYRRNVMQETARFLTLHTNSHVIPIVIDVTTCKKPNGEEDWDAETPLVLTACGQLNAVFSSEPNYDNYFSRAYPNAEHILVDPPRVIVPISGTLCRNMIEEEARKWM